jgi:vacuolar-type H+-ATPase subunit F/Vma7
MKVLVIGHPEAVLGFSLVGVHGKMAGTAQEANQALDEALSAPDVADLVEARMDELKRRSTVPLVVEIPGAEGTRADRPPLREVIRRAIGVKI